MSRIGKKPIDIPDKVKVQIDGNLITAVGDLGTLTFEVSPELNVEQENNQLVLTRKNEERKTRALHGLNRTLASNTINGVATGFSKNLEIQGVGYRAAKEGNKLVLQLGYSHPVEVNPPQGIDIVVEGNTKITVKGADKQAVGDVAAEIRSKRPPEVYKGKGIRYAGEYVRKKAGKTGK